MNSIITIARQYGSGGREVGMKLSEKLGIPFYNRELITMSVEKSGMSHDVLADVDEKAANSLLYTLAVGSSMMHTSLPHNIPINDKLFLLQCEVIRELADKGPCIIVGRCGDYVLQKYTNCIKTFIYADFDDRVKRISERNDVDESKARDLVIKTDKRRANYYNYYSGQKWGKLENYNLALNTSVIGIDGAVDVLANYVSVFEK